MTIGKKLFFYLKNILSLKKNDIFLVSFPKSGNTWVRFYICNLINQIPEYRFTNEAVNFRMLDETMVELGASDLTRKWQFKGFPRIIKTHLAYKPILGKRKTILIIRDPRDVMVSFYKYETTKTNANSRRFKGNSFEDFIRHPKFGIGSWCRHYLSWKKHAQVIIRYEDIQLDDKKVFTELNKFLGISVTNEILEKALELSRFDSIKKVEAEKDSLIAEKFGTSFQFTRSGKTGQWKSFFSEKDINYMNKILKDYSINVYN